MRDKNRLYDFYNVLMDTHITYVPDLSFGQICGNLFKWIRGEYKVDPFFVEDDKMKEYIDRFITTMHKE